MPGTALLAQQPTASDSEDDEPNPYRAGLVVRYQGADSRQHVALADQIAFAWQEKSPDRRVPSGPFTASFAGRLQVQSPGIHRLHVFSSGAVRLGVNGRTLIDAHSPVATWHEAEPIELAFGYHALEVEYRRADEPGRLALFWEGPGFQLEPVAGRWLHHDAAQSPSDEFEQGAQLVRALRCQACHDIPGEAPAIKAPGLNTLAGNVSRDWLVQWLSDPQSPAHRNMPHFRFMPDEAAAVADHLLALSSEAAVPAALRPAVAQPPAAKKKKKDDEPHPPPLPEPDAAQGATLFRSLGCLACHRVGELGSDHRFGGGDLSRVADKRPAEFFRRWLDNPAALNRDHRMPVFALEPRELESLSQYLETLHGPKSPTAGAVQPQAERGRALVAEARCAACHTVDAASAPLAPARIPLDLKAVNEKPLACLSPVEGNSRRPHYRLNQSEAQAVASFLSQLAPVVPGQPVVEGRVLLAERNCLACHARDGSPGLTPLLPAIAEPDAQLAPVLAALTPPPLSSVGDKLHDAALLAAITVSQPPRHTWLRVRMPRFPLAAHEPQQIAAHLIDADRIPERPATRAPSASSSAPADSAMAAQEAAGPRLVTADGFGCTSCHAIGNWQPQKVAINAQGANLSQLGDRIRRPWFDRWVRNPARIIPQMEMPAVQQPVRGVLDGQLDAQLAAAWRVLNRPGFTPPSPSALRVVRRSNRADVVERAAVLTDVVEVDGKQFVKPLIVGLANRHNVLYDLASARLAAWWLGDTARQQTRGKSWYWEAGVPQLLEVEKPDANKHQAELLLLSESSVLEPIAPGQYPTEFDAVRHVPGGVRFEHRLHFPSGSGKPTTLRLAQTITAASGQQAPGGLARRLEIDGVARGHACQLLILPGPATLGDDGRSATLLGKAGGLRVQLVAPKDARLVQTERGAAVRLPAVQGHVDCTLHYHSEVAADQFAPLPVADRSLEPQTLDIVPRFEAVRLPTTDQAMPTGLAWQPDGTLIVTSLEGRVWLGHDTDRDGLVDRLEPFSDELAAPFGVAAADQSIDVINKYGLLRLTDADGDGHAEQMQRLASGWGHTRDYHDWAVGLPRDGQGNYYLSLPCQQDERPAAGALLRGTVVRLTPREPTADDPALFAIDPLCAGLRFPQGIALSPRGDLFVTDNQGNYTPFNELNHVVRGARYGFINRLENKPGFAPPFRSAAVEIPHPWTRSVNGICFLTPATEGRAAESQFGPFTGHLIGCEYDTRRLVRMSLEQVQGEYQGAVYPFSREPAAGEATFEGPLTCAVSPVGDLYIGNIRDSGWGAGANTGSLVRLRYRGQPAPGIAEVRAVPRGFAIALTTAVDPNQARNTASYSIASYRRVPTPDYGGSDRDRRVERIRALELSSDGKLVTILLGELREGFVYEFHLRNLAGSASFFPAEAYYTLRHAAP